MKPRALAALAALALLVTAPRARADEPADEQARPLFDAGKQAYDAGNFPAAIQAFEAAYKIAQRPGIAFSMAQAHRRQYYIDKRSEHVREALKDYREYLDRVPQGGRRGEVAQAIAELEPIAERLNQAPPVAEGPKPPPPKPETRLMVPRKIPGSTISVDKGKPEPLPLFAEVKPGPHTLRITADGYFPEDRDVQVIEGVPLSIDISLREMPGRLEITGADGAQVTIDGRLTGALPLQKPLDVPPGHHLVAITRNGYKAFTEEVDVDRGQTKPIAVTLERTRQRIGSYVLFGVGVAGVATGVVCGLLAGGAEKTAQDINTRATSSGGLSGDDLTKYANAKKARDALRPLAGTAVGLGAAAGALGFLLYLFDQPVISAPRVRLEDKGKTPSPKDAAPMDLTAGATIGPGLYGASLRGRF